MGQQHVVEDAVAAQYAQQVDHVWASWEPALVRGRASLMSLVRDDDGDTGQLTGALRVAQYRAHTASEFAAGLLPPPSAHDAHGYLVAALAACRDTLGVVATRAELDELDGELADLGVTALDVTIDAFRGARTTTALVHAWVASDEIDVVLVDHGFPTNRSRLLSVALWSLAAACIVVAIALVLVVMLVAVPN